MKRERGELYQAFALVVVTAVIFIGIDKRGSKRKSRKRAFAINLSCAHLSFSVQQKSLIFSHSLTNKPRLLTCEFEKKTMSFKALNSRTNSQTHMNTENFFTALTFCVC